MKKQFILLTVLLFFLTTQLVISQKIIIDSETGTYTSEQIIKVDNITRNQLFDNAMEWVALNYKSAQDVIQYSNKESGKIICKGAFPTNLFMKTGHINHTLTLEFKEGRYRQIFSNFSYYSSGTGELAFESKNMGFKKKIYKEANNNIILSTLSLKKYLTTSKTNDDW